MSRNRVEAADLSPVPLTGCDCFHLAIDALMRRSGQGPNLAQAVLELDRPIDRQRLEHAAAELGRRYPILHATIRRGPLHWVPAWRPAPAGGQSVPVDFWRERPGEMAVPGEGAGQPAAREASPPAAAAQPGAPATPGRGEWIASRHELFQRRLNEPLAPACGSNLRLDVVQERDGRFAVAATWSHILLDAKGGELLLSELERLSRPEGGQQEPDTRGYAAAPARPPLRQRLARITASGERLDELAASPFRSLGGPGPRAGGARYRVVTVVGWAPAGSAPPGDGASLGLFRMPFFLACAVRAHDRVFRHRGVDPGGYVVSLPVQTRRPGVRGPIFQNHVTILFFRVTRAEAASVDDTVRAVRAQFAAMVRDRLDESFAIGLELARWVPSRVYMYQVRRQFGGEITSFYHSHTGPFAPELESFLGARVRNAYHVPAVSSPPGTGLFFGERDEKLNLTLSWREGCLSEAECELMLDQVQADLDSERGRASSAQLCIEA